MSFVISVRFYNFDFDRFSNIAGGSPTVSNKMAHRLFWQLFKRLCCF